MLENVLRRNERRFVKNKALDRNDFLAKADFKCSGVVVLKRYQPAFMSIWNVPT